MSRCDDGGRTRADEVGRRSRRVRRVAAGPRGRPLFARARGRSRPRLAAGVAVALVLVLAGSAAAWSAASGAGGHVSTPQAGSAGVFDNSAARLLRNSPSQVVTLITGDRVHLVTMPGGLRIAAIQPSGITVPGARSFVRFSAGGDQFVVPVSALPYLGTTLDPALFDVDLLARLREGGNAGRALTVKITGSATAAPGTHIQRRAFAGGAVPASIGLSALKAWGRQIALSTAAVLAPGARTRTPVFPFGIQHIELAGGSGSAGSAAGSGSAGSASGSGSAGSAAGSGSAGSAGVAGPGTSSSLRMHTLHVSVAGFFPKNPAADLVTAVLVVQNVDNKARFNDGQIASAADPAFAVSVPAGTYSIEGAMLIAPSKSHPGIHLAMVSAPQFSVTKDTSVAIDATQTRTVTASVTGGPSGRAIDRLLEMSRSSAVGGAVQFLLQAVDEPTVDLRAQPTPKVTVGRLNFAPWFRFGVDRNGATLYNLFYPGSGVPSNPRYSTPFADLAREVDKFYSARPQRLVFMPNPFATGWAVSDQLLFSFDSFSVPAQEVNYFNPGRGAAWVSGALNVDPSNGDQPMFANAYHHYQAGEHRTQEWFKAPMRPSVQEESIAKPAGSISLFMPYGEYFPCAACRQDDNLFLYLRPFGDSQLDHQPLDMLAGAWAHVVSSTDFYDNGKLVDDRPLPEGILPQSPAAATYRLRWDVRGAGPFGERGARTTTTWTFRSARSAPSAMPGFESCLPDPTRRCSFAPFIFLRYRVPLSLSDAAAVPGPVTLTIDAYHQGGDTTSPAVKSASLAVSFNRGKTWTQVRGLKSRGHGRFTAVVDQPPLAATDGFASLRVRATDAAGNTVDQTLIDAYSLVSKS
jgi:hypothetical protein